MTCQPIRETRLFRTGISCPFPACGKGPKDAGGRKLASATVEQKALCVRGSFSRCPGCGAALTRNGPPGKEMLPVGSHPCVRPGGHMGPPLHEHESDSTAPERPVGPPWVKTIFINLQAAARPRLFLGPRLSEPAPRAAWNRTGNGNVRSSSLVRRHCAPAPPGKDGANICSEHA